MKFRKINDIYFVGIGGIGMSGIAELLHNLDFNISGSDLSDNENVHRLRKLGVNITIGHRERNIKRAPPQDHKSHFLSVKKLLHILVFQKIISV